MSQVMKSGSSAARGQPAVTLATTRAHEWWVYKFAPILATFYATTSLFDQPLLPLLGRLLGLLFALVIGAIYVSVLNDWTDLRDDIAAGKTNRLAGRSPWFIGTVLGGCVGAGVGCSTYFWQLNPATALLYLGAWISYSLYSLPPIRLKVRGFAGVLADASGAHVFPQLLTMSVAGQWTGQAVPNLWWIAIGIWALACGVRNILWHQLNDAAADARAQVDTFVCRRGVRLAQRLGQLVVFPVEVVAFGGVLVLNYQAWTIGLLGLYVGLEWCRLRIYGYRPAVLQPDSRLILNDYYQFFYPLALLLAQCGRYPADSLVLVLHLVLFRGYAWQFVQEGQAYLRLVVRKVLVSKA